MASSRSKAPSKIEDEDEATFTVDGVQYSLAFDDLTLGELVQLEQLAGLSFQEIDFESALGLQGLAWIAISRKKPEFTLTDAAALPISAFREPTEPDPT